MTPAEPSMDKFPELVWTPQMTARFWNFESGRPQNFFTYQLGAALIQYFRRYLDGATRVVDYGAGPGFLMEDLIAAGYRCAALEFAPNAVSLLTQKMSAQPNFLGAVHIDDAASVEGRFDLAFVVEVVEHLYDQDLEVCLQTTRRLLSPGGLLIITTPNNEDRSQSFLMNPETGNLFHRWQHVRSWTAASLQQEVCRHGFESVEVGVTDLGASISAVRRTLPLPIRIARAAAKWMLRFMSPNTKPPHLYMVARKV